MASDEWEGRTGFPPKNFGFPRGVACHSKTPVSGQGFWKFTPVVGAMPVPAEALPKLKGAPGTVFVDYENDLIYWGLENIGWVGSSNHLKSS